jgi:hypothetical protein
MVALTVSAMAIGCFGKVRRQDNLTTMRTTASVTLQCPSQVSSQGPIPFNVVLDAVPLAALMGKVHASAGARYLLFASFDDLATTQVVQIP